MRHLLIFIPLIVFLVTSCSVRSPSEAPMEMQIDLKNIPAVVMDPESARESEALHHFLLGQLSYSGEEYGEALKNFEKASELIEKPAPVLHVKLAQLFIRKGDLEGAYREAKRAVEAEPDNVYNLLLLAGILESLGRAAEAEPMYLLVIEKSVSSVDAHILLSNLYLKQEQPDKSINLLNNLRNATGDTAIVNYYLGRAYEQKGNFDEAAKHILKAQEIEAGNLGFAVDLIRIYLRAGNLEKVKAICTGVLEKDPKNIIARRVMGQLLIGENRFDEALQHLQVLESVEEDTTDTRFKVALIQIDRQNFEEAVRELNIVLAQKPDHAEARYYLGSAYGSTGKTKEAVEELLKIKKDSSLFVKSRTLAAFILRQQKNLSEAEGVLREALEVDADNKHLISYFVMLLREERKLAEAEQFLKAVTERDPQDEKSLFSYGVILSELKRPTEALAVMNRVLEINPKHSDALNYIAYTLAESGQDLQKSLKMIKEALELKPGDGYYLDTLGWVYFQMGDYRKAFDALRQAVNLTGDDALIIEHFGDVQSKLGQAQEALENYKLALEKANSGNDLDREELVPRLQEKIDRLRGEISSALTQPPKK